MSSTLHLAKLTPPCLLFLCSVFVFFILLFLVNISTMEVVGAQEINITGADTTEWELRGLTEGSLYRFLLSACTRAGCGPAQAVETNTPTNAREYSEHSGGAAEQLKQG